MSRTIRKTALFKSYGKRHLKPFSEHPKALRRRDMTRDIYEEVGASLRPHEASVNVPSYYDDIPFSHEGVKQAKRE